MFKTIKKSLVKINYKLFLSLLVLGLVPTIYTTLRVFFLGNLPGEYSYSIAGQLSWVNLLYEILSEAIILPLFFFIGKSINNKEELTNKVKTGLIITFCIYFIFSILIVVFVKPLLLLMSANKEIVTESIAYIRLESIAMIFSMLANFTLIVLVTLGKDKYVYIVTALKLVLCLVLDTFLVSTLNCSLNIGVNGIAISNIIVNIVLFGTTLLILIKEGINVFNKQKLSFSWTKDFFKIGCISGLESFVRNLAYILMVSRMVNIVNESGTYWVANNFIWGWLLLPISQLAELIKQDVSTDENAIKNKSIGYFTITTIICILWFVTIPVWKPFMSNVLAFNEVEKLFELVLILVGFYVLYAYQNVFDATFYGAGKINYMLLESVVTNTIYYGIAFVLYLTNIWVPTLTGIALLFGIGTAFDSIVSLGVYVFFLKKRKINILDVEE